MLPHAVRMAKGEGRLVVITGVSRGLGRAMVTEFIADGQTVIGCGRDSKAMKELAGRHAEPHRFDVIDVSNETDVAAWAGEVIRTRGVPDLVLNNAALINRNANLWEISGEEFGRIIDVNIKGVANVIRHFAPAMVKRNAGVIVNFSSGWGRSASGEVATYCATKWAIEGLSQAMAQEVPSGMAVVPLNPGVINTDMLQSCFGASAASYPVAEQWAKTAVPFLLALGPRDNGRPVTAP